MNGAGALRDRVAFDTELEALDGTGGRDRTWQQGIECWAELRYDRGREVVQAGGVTGTAAFKVKVRSNTATRGLSAGDRMRDVRRGLAFNIREVDAVTDRAFVWIGVEGGVAV